MILGIWIVLEQIRSPGNLGTLIRTSEAIGSAGFILLGHTVDPFEPKTIRSSMGALFHQMFSRTHSEALRHWIRRHNCHVVGTAPEGEKTLFQCRYLRATLLFLGEERKGLSDIQRKLCHKLVHIPMVGNADPLNVSIAGSLIMYDMYRSKGRSS